ncbi:MAG: hypothetical protein EBU46_04265 [Nitrosomonadaceae bacterium]|nr:hypothetical protein [Nitrosomonadaceae bacterium]
MDSITRITFLKRAVSVVMGMLIIGCTADNNLKANPPGKPDTNQTTSTKSTQQGETMKFSIKPPESWLWSHDIAPDYIDDVLMPGMHLARLSSYGAGKNRRFAAIVYREPGIEGHYLRDVPAAELDGKIAGMAARPVSITADDTDGQPRFSLALQKGPEPKTTVLTGLDEAGLSKLANDRQRIADFTTYLDGGVRKYAAIVEDRPGPSMIFTRVTAEELDAQLRKHSVTPLRIRGFSENGVRYFTAVAERLDVGKWAWYDDIDGDTVGSKLEKHNAYPFDLEAYRTGQGVRFTVVMYRDRN